MEFIVFGGIIFWILTAIFLLAMFLSVHHEKMVGALVCFIFYILIIDIFGPFSLFAVFADPVPLIAFVSAYFACGTIWTVIKWHFYTSKVKRDYLNYANKFFESNNIPENERSNGQLWKELTAGFLKSRSDDYGYPRYGWEDRSKDYLMALVPPKVSAHKSSIMVWLSYWPFSFLHDLLGDGVQAVWNSIYHGIGNYLQSISNRKFKNIDQRKIR